MTAEYIINSARSSELRNLSNKTLTDSALLSYLNRALTALHRAINLRIGIEVVKTSEDVFVYDLRSKDIFTILSVYKPDGRELRKKEFAEDNEYDLTVLGYNTIMLKNPEHGELVVTYRASAAPVENLDDEIAVADVHVEALLAYMTYLGFKALGGEGVDYQKYLTEFNAEVDKSISEGVGVVDDYQVMPSTQAKGFV